MHSERSALVPYPLGHLVQSPPEQARQLGSVEHRMQPVAVELVPYPLAQAVQVDPVQLRHCGSSEAQGMQRPPSSSYWASHPVQVPDPCSKEQLTQCGSTAVHGLLPKTGGVTRKRRATPTAHSNTLPNCGRVFGCEKVSVQMSVERPFSIFMGPPLWLVSGHSPLCLCAFAPAGDRTCDGYQKR